MNNQLFSQRNQFTSPYFNSTPGASATTNNIVWVQGIEGAKAWQLAPEDELFKMSMRPM